jgi:hypothetical protein
LTIGYATICSVVREQKMFPRIGCPGLMAGNVSNWRQSMSGCSRVAYLSLRLVEGYVVVWYQSLSSAMSLDGPKELQSK